MKGVDEDSESSSHPSPLNQGFSSQARGFSLTTHRHLMVKSFGLGMQEEDTFQMVMFPYLKK